MELADALDLARTTSHSVLTTIRRSGRPQLSNVLHHVSDDGVIRISTTADRAKYRNLTRVPWAALHVSRSDFFGYAVIEGDVELTPVAASPDDPTVEELVALYRGLAGEHEDWSAYRKAMINDQRAVVRVIPTGAYGRL